MHHTGAGLRQESVQRLQGFQLLWRVIVPVVACRLHARDAMT